MPCSPASTATSSTALAAARPFGYDRSAVISSAAGNLHASLYGRYGEEVTFGSEKSTSLLVLGGCHLPAAQKPRS